MGPMSGMRSGVAQRYDALPWWVSFGLIFRAL